MTSFKDFDESKMVDYSLEELRGFVKEIEMMKSIINQKMTDEIVAEVKDDSFDIYSRRGEKKIKKISGKYVGSLIGADSFLDLIQGEISKREQYEEEMRYSGRGIRKRDQLSTEEFLKKEEDKTLVHRTKIE